MLNLFNAWLGPTEKSGSARMTHCALARRCDPLRAPSIDGDQRFEGNGNSSSHATRLACMQSAGNPSGDPAGYLITNSADFEFSWPERLPRLHRREHREAQLILMPITAPAPMKSISRTNEPCPKYAHSPTVTAPPSETRPAKVTHHLSCRRGCSARAASRRRARRSATAW